MNAFIEEIEKRKINNVSVSMVGCIGVCRLEPVAEIIEANGEKQHMLSWMPKKSEELLQSI